LIQQNITDALDWPDQKSGNIEFLHSLRSLRTIKSLDDCCKWWLIESAIVGKTQLISLIKLCDV